MLAKRGPVILFTAIVLLAIYLRLAHLDLAEFKRDEADVALRAAGVLEGRIPLVGIGTSVPGLENGPLMIYLTALPLALANDAALASGFVGLMNVLALVVSARFTERVFGRMTALFAAAAYAFGSWAVLFSRKLWPNEAMPLFSALLALSLYDAVVGGRTRGVAMAGLWLGCLLNLHPSGAAFVPFALLALLLRPALYRTRAALLGAGAVVLVSLPFLVHEVTNRLPTLRALRGVAGGGASLDASAFELALALAGPQGYAALSGDALGELRARAISAYPIGEIASLLVVVGVGFASLQLARRLRAGIGWRAPALALMWLLVPILVSSRRTLPLQIHYLIPLLPALFPFVGVALAAPFRVTRLAAPPLRWIAIAPAVLFLAWSGLVQVQHFGAFLETVRVAGGRSLYGVPLVFQKTAVERALTYASGRPIVLVTQPTLQDGAPAPADDLPPIWRFLAPRPVELRFDDGGGAIQLGAGGSLYVVAPSADPVAGELLAAQGAAAGRGVPLPGLARGYEYWRAAAAPASRTAPILGRLENGLRLDAATHPDGLVAGRELRVVADWRVEQPPPAEELAFFVHLLDDRGERLAASDRSGLEAGRLEVGDQLLTWGHLTPPPMAPGRYWLALGAYRARDVRRLSVVDDAGRPTGDTIRLGPLKVAVATVAGVSGPALARFEHGIELVAAELPPAPVAGQPAEIRLLWRATARPDRDLTVFVHLVDAAGRVVAQDDRQPANRSYPTSIWDAGEQIADPHVVAAPPGRHRLLVGLYDAANLQRIGRTDAAGDSVDVGMFEAATRP